MDMPGKTSLFDCPLSSLGKSWNRLSCYGDGNARRKKIYAKCKSRELTWQCHCWTMNTTKNTSQGKPFWGQSIPRQLFQATSTLRPKVEPWRAARVCQGSLYCRLNNLKSDKSRSSWCRRRYLKAWTVSWCICIRFRDFRVLVLTRWMGWHGNLSPLPSWFTLWWGLQPQKFIPFRWN